MNLFLRPLENPNNPTWSVIISLVILLFGVSYYIYTIMSYAFEELADAGSNQQEGRGSGSNDSTSNT